jgi:hypothetical protein
MSANGIYPYFLEARIMEQTERYVNDVEAAMILSISPQTLRNYRHMGKGPAYSKRGRMVRYKIADLFEFMKSGRVDPGDRCEAVSA